jgi:hypothetical protein
MLFALRTGIHSASAHVNSHHKNEKHFECQVCGQGFGRKNDQKVHEGEKHGVKIVQYPCRRLALDWLFQGIS